MRRLPATDQRDRARTWLCALLLFVVGLSQQLVLCAPEDGPAQIEFLHDEGDCCAHAASGAAGEPAGGESADSDPRCEHFELAIDVGAGPQRDADDVPAAAEAYALVMLRPVSPPGHGGRALPPPATGPPRPRPWLAHLRTLVLLI